MYNLACCYADGHGVQEDGNKASRWFSEAARRGYAPAVNDPIYGNVKSLSPPAAAADLTAAPDSSAGHGHPGSKEAGGGEALLGKGLGSVLQGERAGGHGAGVSREPTEEEKRLFPGLVGEIPAALPDAPASRGTPTVSLADCLSHSLPLSMTATIDLMTGSKNLPREVHSRRDYHACTLPWLDKLHVCKCKYMQHPSLANHRHTRIHVHATTRVRTRVHEVCRSVP